MKDEPRCFVCGNFTDSKITWWAEVVRRKERECDFPMALITKSWIICGDCDKDTKLNSIEVEFEKATKKEATNGR